MCARRTYRPVEPPNACNLRRARGRPEVWCFASIDSRLSGASGRCGGWLSGPAGLGCEVIGRRACQVSPSRIYSQGLPRVARERRQRECPRRHSLPRTGASSTFPNARHTPDRHCAFRRRGPVALEWSYGGLRFARRSLGRGGYREAAASDRPVCEQVDAPTQSASIRGRVRVATHSAVAKLLIIEKTAGRALLTIDCCHSVQCEPSKTDRALSTIDAIDFPHDPLGPLHGSGDQ